MTVEQLIEMHQRRPFQPFDFLLVDSRALPVGASRVSSALTGGAYHIGWPGRWDPRDCRSLAGRLAEAACERHGTSASQAPVAGRTVRVARPADVVAALRQTGFDATARSSMVVVHERIDLAGSHASPESPRGEHWLGKTIYLPNGRHMRPTNWEHMARLIGEAAEG